MSDTLTFPWNWTERIKPMPLVKGGGNAIVRTPEIALSYSGQIGTTEVVNVVLTETLTLPASFAGSRAYSDDLATNTNALQVNRISGGVSTLIGTVTFAPAGATFGASTSTTFVPGDTLQVVAPGTTDPTLFNPAITFLMASDAGGGEAIANAPFNYPAAGLVYSTGAAFQPATVQAPLALSGNVLSVSCVFSLGGAVGNIAVGDRLDMNTGTLSVEMWLPLMNGATAPSGVLVGPDGQAIGVRAR